MRRLVSIIVLAGLLGCAGCIIGKPPITPTTTIEQAKALPPVTPERVNDQNYRAVAQALADEMDREERLLQFGQKAP